MKTPRFLLFSSTVLSWFFLISSTVKVLATEIGTKGADSEAAGCRTILNATTGVPTFGCLAEVLVNAIQWAYGFSLVAGIGYFIFGGITFMMAQDEKGIKAGRDKMVWSVFGFVFIILSFLLLRFALLLLGFPDMINNFSFFVKP